MGKVGRWITDPQTGGQCTISLDDGDKIRLIHVKGSSKDDWLTIDRLKFFGFSSERIFVCNLNSPEGIAALSFLTREATPRSIDATPLGAFELRQELSVGRRSEGAMQIADGDSMIGN